MPDGANPFAKYAKDANPFAKYAPQADTAADGDTSAPPEKDKGEGEASPRAQALKETITGTSDDDGQALFEKQQGIEKRLRAAGKSDSDIENDPEWQAASKDLSRSISAAGTSTAIGETAGAAAMG